MRTYENKDELKNEINKSFAKYISEFDIFKGGKTVYHVDKVVRETGKVLKDGLDEMYVNTVIDDGTEIAALMGCFHQEMVTDPRFPEIGKRVHYLKEDKKGVGIMCQALEKNPK